jgi:hypothetical protein
MRLSGFTVAKLGFADSREMELAAREALDQARAQEEKTGRCEFVAAFNVL